MVMILLLCRMYKVVRRNVLAEWYHIHQLFRPQPFALLTFRTHQLCHIRRMGFHVAAYVVVLMDQGVSEGLCQGNPRSHVLQTHGVAWVDGCPMVVAALTVFVIVLVFF